MKDTRIWREMTNQEKLTEYQKQLQDAYQRKDDQLIDSLHSKIKMLKETIRVENEKDYWASKTKLW
jgi:hypothetical protein